MTNPFRDLCGLASISVNAGNESFRTSNGVLFKYSNLLVAYPAAKADSTYAVPPTVESIAVDAFRNADWFALQTLTVGSQALADMALEDLDAMSGASVVIR